MDTMQFQCERCGYQTDNRSNFHKHIKRKIVCAPVLSDKPIELICSEYLPSDLEKSFKCPTCTKSFATRSGVAYHRARCENTSMSVMEDRINALEKELAELKLHQTDAGQNSLSCSGDNNTNNVATNMLNFHVHVNDYGKENKDYITFEFAKKCFEMGWYGILDMMDKLFFNDEHPENFNVRLASLKNCIAEVMKNQQWEPASLSHTIDSMIHKSGSEIIERVGDMLSRNPSHMNLTNMNSIQNLKPEAKKKVRETTKSRLIKRRNERTTNH